MALVPVSGVVTVSETDKTKPVYYQLLHQPPYNKTQDTNHWYQLNSRPWLEGWDLWALDCLGTLHATNF